MKIKERPEDFQVEELTDVRSQESGPFALYRLEKSGWIAGKWEISSTNRRARFYRLMPAGRKQLALEQSKWEQMSAAITRVMRPA